MAMRTRYAVSHSKVYISLNFKIQPLANDTSMIQIYINESGAADLLYKYIISNLMVLLLSEISSLYKLCNNKKIILDILVGHEYRTTIAARLIKSLFF